MEPQDFEELMKDGYKSCITQKFMENGIFYEFLNDHICLYRRSETLSEQSKDNELDENKNENQGHDIFYQIVNYLPLIDRAWESAPPGLMTL